MSGNTKTPLPVFVKAEHVPNDITVYEICSAAEKVSGPVTIDGAICISGLWRISPLYEASRIKILASGINVRGRNVQLENINPFTMRSGDDTSGTKLFIGNLPFSYSTEAIKNHLKVAGVTLRSEVVWERARGPDGSLSDWKTGRRMVWINVPQKPLNKYMKMGNGFSANLYYKEMRQTSKCHKCLEVGHIAKNCDKEVVCMTCMKPGHIRGDPICDLGITTQIHSDEMEGKSDIEDDDAPTSVEERSELSESDAEDGEILSSDNEDLADEGKIDTKDEENDLQNTLEKEVSPDVVRGKNEEIEQQKSPTKEKRPNEVSGKNVEIEQQKSPTKEKSPDNKKGEVSAKGAETERRDVQLTPSKTKNVEKKATNIEQSSKNKNENGKKGKSKPVSKGSFKQAHITEYTPGGKRNSEEMISPDTLAKHPQTKKLNLNNSNN